MPGATILQFPSMANTDPLTLPNRLRALRLEQGFTLKELAPRAGLTFSHLGALETGARELTMPVMERLAEQLGVPVADLLWESMGGLSDDERRLIDTYRAGQAAMAANVATGDNRKAG